MSKCFLITSITNYTIYNTLYKCFLFLHGRQDSLIDRGQNIVNCLTSLNSPPQHTKGMGKVQIMLVFPKGRGVWTYSLKEARADGWCSGWGLSRACLVDWGCGCTLNEQTSSKQGSLLYVPCLHLTFMTITLSEVMLRLYISPYLTSLWITITNTKTVRDKGSYYRYSALC